MIKIIPHRPELASFFHDINKEWIESMFTLESVDKKVLEDPETHILQPGGSIWYAQHTEHGIVGTCALRKMKDHYFELTKMGVLKKARGLKVGETLLKFVIDFVHKERIQNCYLLTNKKCEAAIHLYEKNGFIHDPDIMKHFGGDYERCDVAMKLSEPSPL